MTNPKTQDFPDSAWVQVPTDGSGKRVSHVLVDEVQSDGTTQIVYFPAVVIAGPKGQIANVKDGHIQTDNADVLEALTVLAREIRELRQQLTVALA